MCLSVDSTVPDVVHVSRYVDTGDLRVSVVNTVEVNGAAPGLRLAWDEDAPAITKAEITASAVLLAEWTVWVGLASRMEGDNHYNNGLQSIDISVGPRVPGQGESTSESECNECCCAAVTAGNFILDKGCGVKADV